MQALTACRLWDSSTQEKLDKDRFRRDLGNVIESYHRGGSVASRDHEGDAHGDSGWHSLKMTIKATVHVFLKPGVLDVQGKAVENALHGLGWTGAANVRVGREITFDMEGDDAVAAERELKAMCEKLLANPVIESWRVDIAP